MIYDAIIFRDEFTCLDVRLHELAEVVHQHIIIEADWTFQGDPKPLHLAESIPSYEEWPILVKELRGDLYPNGSTWAREAVMREAILEALAAAGAADGDHVILSDVDEVPNAASIEAAITMLTGSPPNVPAEPSIAWEQEPRFYRFNNRVIGMEYKGSQVMTVATLRKNGVERMRCHRWEAPSIPGGWHFCNLGDADDFIRKLQTFAHEELNKPEYTNREFVEELIASGRVLDGEYETEVVETGLPRWLADNRDAPDLAEYFYEPATVG